jgi:hypothetical protein
MNGAAVWMLPDFGNQIRYEVRQKKKAPRAKYSFEPELDAGYLTEPEVFEPYPQPPGSLPVVEEPRVRRPVLARHPAGKRTGVMEASTEVYEDDSEPPLFHIDEHTLVFHYDLLSRARAEDPRDVQASDEREFEAQTSAMISQLRAFVKDHGIHDGVAFQTQVYLAEWQKTQAVPFIRRSLGTRLLRLGSLFDRTTRAEPFTVVFTRKALVSVEPRISTSFGARAARFLFRQSKDVHISSRDIVRGLLNLGLLAGVAAIAAALPSDEAASAMAPAMGGSKRGGSKRGGSKRGGSKRGGYGQRLARHSLVPARPGPRARHGSRVSVSKFRRGYP